jgi:selenocysteine lyase/cysteine desulfurase
LSPGDAERGNFLVLRDARAQALHDALLKTDILVDCRADRLRIGFGLYQDAPDIDEFFRRVVKLA